MALVPLLVMLEGKSRRYGFLLSHLCGMGFIIGTFQWILEVPNYTALHHSLLVVYFGAYVGLFGLGYCFISGRWGRAPALFATPFLWVSLEYCKSNLSFLALPWALLAHSQYRFIPIIQLSSIAGAYGVSFLIVVVNSAVAGVVHHVIGLLKRDRQELIGLSSRRATMALVAIATALTSAALIYGHMILSNGPVTGRQLKVSVLQGNIEQAKKWDPAFAAFIMQKYKDLTGEAAKEQPALIVWPEGATPRAIDQDARLRAHLGQIAREASTYLLVGSSQHRKFRDEGPRKLKYVNSAFLISPALGIENSQRYDKVRLLPFGEYLPFKGVIPWTYFKIPELTEYAPGTEFTVFRLPEFQFGVTICWENIFPDLARQLVRDGAHFIVNITNEAWFGKIAAPYQFLSMSVFRAVENRTYVVRCSNTGISCFIDPCGRIVDRVRDEGGCDIFVQGLSSQSVVPLQSQTFYTKYGDWPAWLSIASAATFLLRSLFRRKADWPPGVQAQAQR